MAKIGRLGRWTSLALVVALAGCGDTITRSTGLPVSEPSSVQTAPNVSGVAVVPATLELTTANGWGDLHTPPGFSPPSGAGYSLVLRGADFPADWIGTAYIYGTFLDGTVIELGAGSGRGADGSYLMIMSADCPSRLREAWAVVMSQGRSIASKHIVPAC